MDELDTLLTRLGGALSRATANKAADAQTIADLQAAKAKLVEALTPVVEQAETLAPPPPSEPTGEEQPQ